VHRERRQLRRSGMLRSARLRRRPDLPRVHAGRRRLLDRRMLQSGHVHLQQEPRLRQGGRRRRRRRRRELLARRPAGAGQAVLSAAPSATLAVRNQPLGSLRSEQSGPAVVLRARHSLRRRPAVAARHAGLRAERLPAAAASGRADAGRRDGDAAGRDVGSIARVAARRRLLGAAAAGLAVAQRGETGYSGSAASGARSEERATMRNDPLPSWNDGPAKQAILDFVAAVTKEGGDRFVPVANRIATFDNDGTLWVEQPNYTQGFFAFDQIEAMAADHPDWKTEQPYAAILAGDRQAM